MGDSLWGDDPFHMSSFGFNIRVLGPWSNQKKMGDSLWEDDPFHMSSVGFNNLADLVTCAREVDGMDAGGSSKGSKQSGSIGPTTARRACRSNASGGQGIEGEGEARERREAVVSATEAE